MLTIWRLGIFAILGLFLFLFLLNPAVFLIILLCTAIFNMKGRN